MEKNKHITINLKGKVKIAILIIHLLYTHILGVKYRIPSPTRERGDGMEDSECSSPNKSNEVTNRNQKMKFTKSKKQLKDKLIILPQTGLTVKTLPPITADKNVMLPSKTPTSPLVQVITGVNYQIHKPLVN